MTILATPIKAGDLKPGDLFSNVGALYWNQVNTNLMQSIGEKVYIRTIEPCPEDQKDDEVHLITFKVN